MEIRSVLPLETKHHVICYQLKLISDSNHCMCVCVCVCVCVCTVSPVWLFATQWNCSQQAPLSLEFPGKNTGVSCRFLPQALPNPGIELVSLVSVGLAGRLLTTRAIWEATMSFVNPGVLFLPPLWWREGLSSANAWVWGGDTWSRSPFHRGTWSTWMTTEPSLRSQGSFRSGDSCQ